MAIQNPNAKPWYKEPWPWILASGPLIVVIAGIWTFRIAVTSSDGLVSEDYYKQGLAVGKTIAQSDNAKAIGLTAHVLFLPERRSAWRSRTTSRRRSPMPTW